MLRSFEIANRPIKQMPLGKSFKSKLIDQFFHLHRLNPSRAPDPSLASSVPEADISSLPLIDEEWEEVDEGMDGGWMG